MAKRREATRAGWSRRNSGAPGDRTEVARASGSSSRDAESSRSADIRRMGPYETSYQIDFGYTGGRETA